MIVFCSPFLALASLRTPSERSMKSFAKTQTHGRRSETDRVLCCSPSAKSERSTVTRQGMVASPQTLLFTAAMRCNPKRAR
jgi:hypothetical protein